MVYNICHVLQNKTKQLNMKRGKEIRLGVDITNRNYNNKRKGRNKNTFTLINRGLALQ